MPATKRRTRRNASGAKRVSRALTKYVRNFTGTITRTADGQVVIAGTGPKPKTAKNPGGWQRFPTSYGVYKVKQVGKQWIVRTPDGSQFPYASHAAALGHFANYKTKRKR